MRIFSRFNRSTVLLLIRYTFLKERLCLENRKYARECCDISISAAIAFSSFLAPRFSSFFFNCNSKYSSSDSPNPYASEKCRAQSTISNSLLFLVFTRYIARLSVWRNRSDSFSLLSGTSCCIALCKSSRWWWGNEALNSS